MEKIIKRVIEDFEIVVHGVFMCDCFNGYGTYGTSFKNIYTGIGDSNRAAIENALEQLAMNEYNVDYSAIEKDLEIYSNDERISKHCAEYIESGETSDNAELPHVYCSILYNVSNNVENLYCEYRGGVMMDACGNITISYLINMENFTIYIQAVIKVW